MKHSTLLCLALTSTAGWARYTLQQDFMEGGNFLNQFTFWDTADPTNGFVQYLSQSDAQSMGMINQTNNQITLASDSTETTTAGRKSIRITSNLSFQTGLVILDLAHMPGSICGSWPAFWTVGPDWPNQGEIDIIEGVNTNNFNAMTLHTGEGCTINSAGQSDMFSGSLSTSNCDINAANQPTNAGCSIDATSSNTYGTGFNNAGGGVYAMELTSSGISIYFFSRDSIPSDINSDSPDPSGWGTPLSSFQGDCDFAQKFTNQQIVFDNTFCGDWAGAVWSSSSCAAQYGSSCENFVGQNPSAFAESYWTINSLKLFSGDGSVGGGSGSGNGGGWGHSQAPASSPVQTTFATGTSPPAGASPSAPARGHGHGHRHGHHHFHGGPQSAPAQGSPPAASAPAGGAPSTASPPAPPASAPAAGAPSPPPTASPAPSQAPQQAGPGGLSSPASPSHTWHWGQGSNNNNNGAGGFPSYSGAQGDVEAMTASVSQNAQNEIATSCASSTASTAPSTASSDGLAKEHDEGNGVYGVVGRRDRERHLRLHKGRRGMMRR